MKKLYLLMTVSALSLFTTALNAQDTKLYKNIPESVKDALDVHHIPQSYMDGLFVYSTLYDSVLDLEVLDPVNLCVCNTYSLLAHVMLGTKFPEGLSDKNLALIKAHMGTDNTLYGLALTSKAVEDDENMKTLLEAKEIIRKTAGEKSWEYALSLFYCSVFTMDFKKYDPSVALKYTNEAIDILSDGYKDSWLYQTTLANRANIKLHSMDETFMDDIVNAYNQLNNATNIDDRNLCPLMYVTGYASSIFAIMEFYDKSIEIAEPILQNMVQMELEQSDIYISLNLILSYSYANKNNKEKAAEYYNEAEKTCIEMFGKKSKKYKQFNFSFYKKML